MPRTCTSGRTRPGPAASCGRSRSIRPRFAIPSSRGDPGWAFTREFEYQATSDPTNYLAAPEGIALLREWGFDAVLSYMHGLSREAARLLTERWGTTLDAADEMIGAMVTVPLPDAAGATADEAARLRTALLVEDRIEVQLHAWRGRLWVRVSAQVYNDRADFTRLADAVCRRL